MANEITQLSRQVSSAAPSNAPVEVLPTEKTAAVAESSGQELPPGGTVSPDSKVSEVPSKEALSETVERINEYVQSVQRDLQFSVDEDSGRVIVTVLDHHTQEVIRQIPPENVLALAENMESLRGVLFSAQV